MVQVTAVETGERTDRNSISAANKRQRTGDSASINLMKEIARGAEAVVYQMEFYGRNAIMKKRLSKKYRHAELDHRLTMRRLTQEARCMLRLRKVGIRVPALLYVDLVRATIIMEDLGGITLREFLKCEKDEVKRLSMMRRAGATVAEMHMAEVVHGDLTTSNLMVLRENSTNGEAEDVRISVIDFGLSTSTVCDEDIAVDLYVFERAVISTHSESAMPLNEAFLDSYSNTIGKASIFDKLNEVRARGRKRDMTG